MLQLKSEPGTYALVLRWTDADRSRASACGDEETELDVGALGTLRLQRQSYIYVGSAFGPGGVRARVRRHARNDGQSHWHVDYLRAVTTLEAVWFTYDARSQECTWATVLRDGTQSRVPMEGFGASDCSCPSHLVACPTAPFASFCRSVHRRVSDHASIHQRPASQLLG